MGRATGTRFGRAGLALIAASAIATGIAACGGDETTTVTEEETAATTTPTETSTTSSTTPTSTSSSTTSTTTTTSGGITPDDCDADQVYSQSSGTCVAINDDGGNPCPSGEVPMADQPICVPRNSSPAP